MSVCQLRCRIGVNSLMYGKFLFAVLVVCGCQQIGASQEFTEGRSDVVTLQEILGEKNAAVKNIEAINTDNSELFEQITRELRQTARSEKSGDVRLLLSALTYLGWDVVSYSEALSYLNEIAPKYAGYADLLAGLIMNRATERNLADYSTGEIAARFRGAQKSNLRAAFYYEGALRDAVSADTVPTDAVNLLLHAMTLGYLRSATYLGSRLVLSADESASGAGLQLLECAADNNDPNAAFFLANHLIETGTNTDDIAVVLRGVSALRKAAVGGHGAALNNLALLQKSGSIVERDRFEAYINFNLAAVQGIAAAKVAARELQNSLSEGDIIKAHEDINRRFQDIDFNTRKIELVVEVLNGIDGHCALPEYFEKQG